MKNIKIEPHILNSQPRKELYWTSYNNLIDAEAQLDLKSNFALIKNTIFNSN